MHLPPYRYAAMRSDWVAGVAVAECEIPFARESRSQHFPLAVEARRTPQRIGDQHALDQWANRPGRSWSASSSAMRVAPSGPNPAESFALPMGDGVRLDREKRTAPTRPPAAKSDPKYSIEGGQNRALAFSLEGCEWEAERGILESDGWVTGHQQSEETEDN